MKGPRIVVLVLPPTQGIVSYVEGAQQKKQMDTNRKVGNKKGHSWNVCRLLNMKRLAGGNSNIFYFHPCLGKNPIWRSYFSTVLEPPTRQVTKILDLQKLIWHVCFLLVCAIAVVAVIPNFNLTKRLRFLLVNIFDWNSTGSGESRNCGQHM